jgi:hypothetical protein
LLKVQKSRRVARNRLKLIANELGKIISPPFGFSANSVTPKAAARVWWLAARVLNMPSRAVA